MEAKLFRRGFREHKKRFDIIQKDISGKSVNELHEYYYMWKKMKPAEYRGRQRHHSDDDVSGHECVMCCDVSVLCVCVIHLCCSFHPLSPCYVCTLLPLLPLLSSPCS